MNVGTLRQLLEGADDELEVMIATQPSWPLAARVANVMPASERLDDDDDDDDDDYTRGRDVRSRRDILWIVAGESNGYAPSDVFMRW